MQPSKPFILTNNRQASYEYANEAATGHHHTNWEKFIKKKIW